MVNLIGENLAKTGSGVVENLMGKNLEKTKSKVVVILMGLVYLLISTGNLSFDSLAPRLVSVETTQQCHPHP